MHIYLHSVTDTILYQQCLDNCLVNFADIYYVVKNVLSKCLALSTGHPHHLIRPDGWGNIYNHAVGMTPSCTSGVWRVV